MYLKNKIFLISILFLFSCQPIETIQTTVFNNSNLYTFSINAKNVETKLIYEPIFSEENIEDQITNPPINKLQSWIENNVSNFGNANKFIINILDASITKKNILNDDAKKYEEKNIFLYEVSILVEYELYDDNGYLIANTTVESYRSTTSQKYISLNDVDNIINELVLNSLIDFTNESQIMLKKYMSAYLVN